jgi:hypothetical protein
VSENPDARIAGPRDEPQTSGAVVAVNWGDYRTQEIWVRSGANIGNWYCIGGEFGRPNVWDPPADPYSLFGLDRQPTPPRPPGTVPQHPHWEDIISRGPVTILTAGDDATYRIGWRNGRQALWESMEDSLYDDPPESR